jgi:hypothetical protein
MKSLQIIEAPLFARGKMRIRLARPCPVLLVQTFGDSANFHPRENTHIEITTCSKRRRNAPLYL